VSTASSLSLRWPRVTSGQGPAGGARLRGRTVRGLFPCGSLPYLMKDLRHGRCDTTSLAPECTGKCRMASSYALPTSNQANARDLALLLHAGPPQGRDRETLMGDRPGLLATTATLVRGHHLCPASVAVGRRPDIGSSRVPSTHAIDARLRPSYTCLRYPSGVRTRRVLTRRCADIAPRLPGPP
jgi:hypothetical protein